MTLQQQLQSALSLHQAGRLAEAEKIYRGILARQPDHADALHLLGSLAGQVGQFDAAIELIRRAIAINPINASYHGNLGNAEMSAGKTEQAIFSYRQAIRLKPDFAEVYSNLGNALTETGQIDEAINICRQAVQLKPGFAHAHNNLGIAISAAGQLDQAIASYRQAIQLQPDFPDAHRNLGIALMDTGQIEQAITSFRHAIRLEPDHPGAHNNLGIALTRQGQSADAIASFHSAIRLKPDYAEAHANLGTALADLGKLDEAIAAFHHAIRLKPDFAGAHNNLGDALKNNGQLDEAVAAFREAIRLKLGYIDAHSNLILALHYHPDHSPKIIYDELRAWNNLHAQPYKKLIQPHSNPPDPDRKLRVGYVSADFYDHASAFFILPLFRNHNLQEFEIFCYSQGNKFDGVTRQIMDQAQCWRKITRLSDQKVAAQIREDQIDILVDLKLHTAENRLLVFAQKPAPVQVAWLGYPGSTGLDTIDYRLTDPFLDPPGIHDAFYSEQSIRLPDTFWCYDSLASELSVNSLPRSDNGFVTFGCLNNFCKINDDLLALWSRILQSMDSSRLLILAPEGSARNRVLAQLERNGTDSERIAFMGKQSRPNFLRSYHRIDIALDAFPCNGHTTSLDSFWMGVPVITLVGPTALGRAGSSQLNNLGLPEFIAQTPDQYVQIAAQLAADLPRMTELRRTLRSRMQSSPLMNAPRFARNVEGAYREMWRSWCAAKKPIKNL